MGVMWLVLAFPSNIVLPDLASIFSAKFWAIIKILEQIKDFVAPKYIIFTLSFMSPGLTIYEAAASLDWVGDTKESF